MKNKLTTTGKCIDISFNGKGVCKTDSGIVFVDGLFIGEEAYIEVTYKRAGNLFGKVSSLTKKSPSRIQPKCGVCSACGGCQFQQLDYKDQLIYKTNKVDNAFKINNLKYKEVHPTLGMDNPYNYRNKIQVPVKKDFHNRIVTGFYKEGSHNIVPIDECFIEDKRATFILKTIKSLMKSFKYEPYDEDKNSGLIRHILIKTSYHYDEVLVTLVTTSDTFKSKNNFIKELVNRCPNIKSIVININKRSTNVIMGEKEKIIYGSGLIKDKIFDLNFLVSSKSFFQVNPKQTEVLYSEAIKCANLNKEDVVLDAYCGVGTITLFASKFAKEVIGVEIVKDAIKDANKNLSLNNINNVSLICKDAGELLQQYSIQNKQFDVVFVDPPRKGLDDKFINALLKIKPKKVVYISCGLESLVSNLKQLSSIYNIKYIQPVDMFPMTYHVETIVLLESIK